MYIQHQEHFHNQKTDREPHKAFRDDLQKAVQAWVSAGEKVVIHMDTNADVRTGPLTKMLATMGFQEQITSTHGIKAPPRLHMIATNPTLPLMAYGPTLHMAK